MHFGPSYSGTFDPPLLKDSELVITRDEPPPQPVVKEKSASSKVESKVAPEPPKAIKASSKPEKESPKPIKETTQKAEEKKVSTTESKTQEPPKKASAPPPEKVYPSTTLADGERTVTG